LVFFLDDITSVLLEFSKCNIYLNGENVNNGPPNTIVSYIIKSNNTNLVFLYTSITPIPSNPIGSNIKDILYERIGFGPQCTIGVNYIDIVDIMKKLLFQCSIDDEQYDNFSDFNIIIHFCNNLLSQIGESIRKSNDQILIDEFNATNKLLLNWFVIILYQVNCILDENGNYMPKVKVYKFNVDILIRHPIQEIFPCSPNMKDFLSDKFELNNDIFKFKLQSSKPLDGSLQSLPIKLEKYSTYIRYSIYIVYIY
jgi:hypothetical protein